MDENTEGVTGVSRCLRAIFKLELFEIVGILASAAAVWLFIQYGQRLDIMMRQPGYHWYMLFDIAGIYAHFVPWALFVGAVVIGVAGWWMKQSRGQQLSRYIFGVRVLLAYCVLLVVFRVVNFYVPVIHPGLRDDALQRMDEHLLFGRNVADWLLPISTRGLTYLLSGVYISWFWLLFATIVILLLVDKKAVTEYVFASLVAFYMGYICYVMIPVIGPGYTLHEPLNLGLISPGYTLDRLTIARDCFPSLHTAISVLMAIYVWRYQQSWSYFYIPIVCLIVFATLYLRFHYLSDDIAGAALAIVISSFAPVCHDWWTKMRGRQWSFNFDRH